MNDALKQLADMKECYPVMRARLPLAVGVRDELVAAGYDAELLRRSLYAHVHTVRYLRKIAQGGQRHHLDGTEAGAIEPEHAEFARQKVAEYDVHEAARRLRVKAAKAELSAKREREAAAKAPAKAPPTVKVAAKPIAKTPPAASPAVTIVVKKKRVLQVPK